MNKNNNEIKQNDVITFKYNMYDKNNNWLSSAGPITMVVGSDTILPGLSSALLGLNYTIKNQRIDFNYYNPINSLYEIVELDLEIYSYDVFENNKSNTVSPNDNISVKNNAKNDKNLKKEISNLQKEINTLQNQITEMNKNDDLLNKKIIEISETAQKQITDFKENYKKQFEIKLKDAKDFQFQSFFEKFLSPLNNLYMAVEFGAKNNENPELVGYVKGFELLVNQMFIILESSGISPIEPKIGDEFDPALHNIVELIETKEFKKDKVIELRNRGYKLNGRVIMPASVLVSKK